MRLAIGIILFIAAIVFGIAFVPPYWANYQFEDAIKTEALISTNSSKSEDAIRDTVYKKAQELEIPVQRDAIKVVRVGSMGSGSVSIDVPYTVQVNLPGYPVQLNFDAATKNRGVM